MIIENISNEAGDQIIIQSDVAIVGLLTLQSFITDIDTEDGSLFYVKEYRISTDGVNYSEWKELTTENLQTESVLTTDTVYLNYRLTQSGDGSLTFNSIQLDGTFEAVPKRTHYDKSQFKEFFSFLDTRVLQWSGAVLERLVMGSEMMLKQVDKTTDYVEYWKAITQFWGYIVTLGREFENLFDSPILLADLIEQRGLFLCGEEDIEKLQSLASNIYREFSKRGTQRVFQESEELTRLICKQDSDEYITHVNPKAGWWLDQLSPGFNGEVNYQKNKLITVADFDTDYEVSDALITATGLDEVTFTDQSTGTSVFFQSGLIPIDSNMDYVISLLARQSDPDQQILSVSVFGYDASLSSQNILDATNDLVLTKAIDQGKLSGTGDNLLKLTIFNSEKSSSLDNSNLYLGNHKNLKLRSTTKYIQIRIESDNDSGSLMESLIISKFAMKAIRKGYSIGSIQTNKLTELYLKNNNGSFTNDEVETKIRQSLIPASSALITNFL